MLYKTKGVVLRLTLYGEGSAIVNILTQAFGLRSYIVKGFRSKSTQNKMGLYQPLNMLDMVVYHKNNANMSHIKEAHCTYVYHNLSTSLKKSGIILFINEVLNKTIKEEGQVTELYEFIQASLATLDTLESNEENFHLIFLIKLTRFLGFGIHDLYELDRGNILNKEEQHKIKQLLTADYVTEIRLGNTERHNILNTLLHFYTVHIHSMGSLKSTPVLQEVFR